MIQLRTQLQKTRRLAHIRREIVLGKTDKQIVKKLASRDVAIGHVKTERRKLKSRGIEPKQAHYIASKAAFIFHLSTRRFRQLVQLLDIGSRLSERVTILTPDDIKDWPIDREFGTPAHGSLTAKKSKNGKK